MAKVNEIAPDLYRISIYVTEFDLQFNHFLVKDDEPLLFHTGYKAMFPLVRDAVATIVNPSQIRWIGFSHFESDDIFGFLTHNQTLEAFTFLIWQGEYQLGFIPKGNHDFHKFIRPEDLKERLARRGLKTMEVQGLKFLLDTDPRRVDFAPTTEISYIGYAING
jgi:hypothetical protein